MGEAPHAAFERLFDEHGSQLLRFLLYRTGDRTVAEDVAADTFERVLRAWPSFDPSRGTEKTWLYGIALNVLRDQLRRRKAEARAIELTAARAGSRTALDSEQVELRDQVSRALSTLSKDERDVVSLRYGADLPVRDIARITQQKPATVEKRLYRALCRLRSELITTPATGA